MPRSLTVSICRGCCCGSTTKHPDTDHDANARAIAAAVAAGGLGVSRVVKCLDECEHSDVVFVRRATDDTSESFWLGPVNDEADVQALTAWLAGPPEAPLPERLRQLRFAKRPPRPPLAIRVANGEETSLTCPLNRPPGS